MIKVVPETQPILGEEVVEVLIPGASEQPQGLVHPGEVVHGHHVVLRVTHHVDDLRKGFSEAGLQEAELEMSHEATWWPFGRLCLKDGDGCVAVLDLQEGPAARTRLTIASVHVVPGGQNNGCYV